MDSIETIEEQISKINLDPVRHTDNKNHLFADFFELLTLFNYDEVSINEFLDTFRKEGLSIPDTSNLDQNEFGSGNAEIYDMEELWGNEIFQICLDRKRILKEQYPFSNNTSSLVLRKDLCEIHKIYIFLLLASNLNYFPYFKSILTSDFEHVSYQSLLSFMPKNAIVDEFGKNTHFRGTAQEKIRKLGQKLNIEIFDKEIERNVRGVQERGLDIIAWIPFNDRTPNFVSILAQCTCEKEWYNKQGQTRRYEKSYYKFYKSPPIHTMFIPYALGTGNSTFYQSDEIDSLLFERFRIIEYIKKTSFFKRLKSAKIINKCISHVIH